MEKWKWTSPKVCFIKLQIELRVLAGWLAGYLPKVVGVKEHDKYFEVAAHVKDQQWMEYKRNMKQVSRNYLGKQFRGM